MRVIDRWTVVARGSDLMSLAEEGKRVERVTYRVEFYFPGGSIPVWLRCSSELWKMIDERLCDYVLLSCKLLRRQEYELNKPESILHVDVLPAPDPSLFLKRVKTLLNPCDGVFRQITRMVEGDVKGSQLIHQLKKLIREAEGQSETGDDVPEV